MPVSFLLIMTVGLPPVACRSPAGRNGTGLSLRQNALGSGVSWRSSWSGTYEP
jgi:hypothetical protein